MTDKEKTIKELKEALDSLDITNKYRLNIIRAIEYLQEEPVSEDFEMALTEMIDKAQKCVVEPWVVAAQWKDELVKLAKGKKPVSKKFAFKAIPRLLEMIEPTDRAKAYIAKLADTLEVEGYSTDAKIVRVSLKIMNGEKVPMATMDKEPVSNDLGEYINELSKQFPEVSFAKLSRIAVRVGLQDR